MRAGRDSPSKKRTLLRAPSKTPQEHRARAPASVRFAILTVSDSRSPETDRGGDTARDRLERAGHRVLRRVLVTDDAERIRVAVGEALEDAEVEALLLTGGTGVAPRDVTVEAVADLLEKRLEGFGEIFRSLSFLEIGPSAFLSRALAGTARGRAVFVLPGSPAAVSLAIDRIVAPEVGHLVAELSRPAGRLPAAGRGGAGC